MKHLIKPLLWVGEGAIIVFVLLPICLMVYASVICAILGMDIYKFIKR